MLRKLSTIGAATRLTRLITADALGEWYILRPAEAWAIRHEGTKLEYADGRPALDEDRGWRSKLVSGLSCPWCVGFWLGAAVLATDELTTGTKLERGWGFAKDALTLNLVTATLSTHLDAGLPQEADHE